MFYEVLKRFKLDGTRVREYFNISIIFATFIIRNLVCKDPKFSCDYTKKF